MDQRVTQRRNADRKIANISQRAVAWAMIALGSVISGCAVNPATGERQFILMGRDQEINIGRENDVQIVAQMGVYPDSAVQRYVRGLGERLAATSEMPNLPWTFRVLDDPTINAFALPGGFVYVTRGIMAHMTSEAQLAGVLGHEIGHVTGRHGASQASSAQLAQIGLIAGSIFSETVADNMGLASGLTGLLFMKFGRDDELQADELGIRYMTNVGYDPRELAGVMRMLDRSSAASGSGRAPEWQSTHPDPANRVEAILAQIDRDGVPANPVVEAASFVNRLDGVTFGPDPREGYLEGSTFHHPELAFRFSIPSGWQLQNGKQAVVTGSDQAQVTLTLQQGSAREAFTQFQGLEGVTISAAGQDQINGLSAWVGGFTATTQNGDLRGLVAFVELDGRTYRLLGITTPSGWNANRAALESTVMSFARETDSGVLARQPNRLDVVRLTSGSSLSNFISRHPSVVDANVISLINQVGDGELMGPGPVKRVVR